MIIKELTLTNFRNHRKLSLSLKDGENLIVGANGTGKTNILEAIYLLATGKSFKARFDQEMIYNPEITEHPSFNNIFDGSLLLERYAKVVGSVINDNNKETLEVIISKEAGQTNQSRKVFKVDGSPKRMYATSEYFNAVIFTPEDLELFTQSPSLRRKFLDEVLFKIDHRYKKEHDTYTKTLRQRNKVLEKINKTGKGQSELPFWTEKIMVSGQYIQQIRAAYIKDLGPQVSNIYNEVSDTNAIGTIEYKINEMSISRLKTHAEHEIMSKTTLVGPHRDDFDFLINNYSISSYGSRGQQRTAILALKISELETVKKTNQSSPVLLLDDIFSELDELHKTSLKNLVLKQQTIITSVDPATYLHPAGNMQRLS